MIRVLFSLIVFISLSEISADERTIITFYVNSKKGQDFAFETFPQTVEMPLNQLGLNLEYHSLGDPLPNLSFRKDIRGIFLWFENSVPAAMERPLYEWLEQAIEKGKRILILSPPFANLEYNRRLFNFIGLRYEGNWIYPTYDVSVDPYDVHLFGFERSFDGVLPGFEYITVNSQDTNVLLSLRMKLDGRSKQSVACALGPSGAYIDQNYAINLNLNPGYPWCGWYVNPFHFFEMAFQTDGTPRPDPTTLAGLRVFYSQIDGDGWDNIVQVQGRGLVYCSDIILERCIRAYPTLPVTVGPIAAEMDLNWVGTEESRRIAKDFFKEPNVEMGCHTFTHPFDWEFFEHYSLKKEKPFFDYYPKKSATKISKFVYSLENGPIKGEPVNLPNIYKLPRAYAKGPFNLKLEVDGAVQEINQLSPNKNKKVAVFQWSGDAMPWGKAVEMVDQLHIQNINGGGSRFDSSFNSYAWLYPFYRMPGGKLQVYTADANEYQFIPISAKEYQKVSLLYVPTWSLTAYMFKLLPDTFERTETPIRVKPMNLYYHMFSSSMDSSMNALIDNFNYVLKHQEEIIPIRTSQYCRMVKGFHSAKIIELENNRWLIKDRNGIQTIRFDDAVFKQVDFKNSKGVIGERQYQGSLYVYLDAAVEKPIISIKYLKDYFEEPSAEKGNIHLVSSRWPVWDLHSNENGVLLKTQGFGAGSMYWRVNNEIKEMVVIAKDKQSKEIFHETVEVNKGKLMFQIPAHNGLVNLEMQKR